MVALVDPFENPPRYGPEGYTTAVREIIGAWITADDYPDESYARFDGLPAEIAQHIVERHLPDELTRLELEDYPLMVELVALAVALPDADLHGSIIGPPRRDERIWFDTLCWRGNRRDIADLLRRHRPASVKTRKGVTSVWWH